MKLVKKAVVTAFTFLMTLVSAGITKENNKVVKAEEDLLTEVQNYYGCSSGITSYKTLAKSRHDFKTNSPLHEDVDYVPNSHFDNTFTNDYLNDFIKSELVDSYPDDLIINQVYEYSEYDDLINTGYYQNNKVGLSSLNGVSLTYSDVYLLTYFADSLKGNNIDLALSTSFALDYKWLVPLSMSVEHMCSIPLVLVDDKVVVEVCLTSTEDPYIICRDSSFYISEDSKTVYLSLGWYDYIEKIRIIHPIFTGGIRVANLSTDKSYVTKYLAGDTALGLYQKFNIFNQVELFNDDINDSENKYAYSPIKVHGLNYENKRIRFEIYTILSEIKINKISYEISKLLTNKTYTSTLTKISSSDKLTDNETIYHSSETTILQAYTIDNFSLDSTCSLKLLSVEYELNGKAIIEKLSDSKEEKEYFTLRSNNNKFLYVKGKSAINVYLKLELSKTHFAKAFTSGALLNYIDLQYVRFDYFYDDEFKEKIEKIDSLHLYLPKVVNNNGKKEFLSFVKTNLQSESKYNGYFKFYDTWDNGSKFYESYPSTFYQFNDDSSFSLDSTVLADWYLLNSKDYEKYGAKSPFVQEVYKTNSLSFKITNVYDNTKEEKSKCTFDELLIGSKQLPVSYITYYEEGSSFVRYGSTNNKGYHVEYDENENPYVVDGNGNVKDDMTVDDKGMIYDKNGDPVLSSEELVDTKIFESPIKEKVNSILNWFKNLTSSFASSIKIVLIVLVALIVAYVISFMIKVVRGIGNNTRRPRRKKKR